MYAKETSNNYTVPHKSDQTSTQSDIPIIKVGVIPNSTSNPIPHYKPPLGPFKLSLG